MAAMKALAELHGQLLAQLGKKLIKAISCYQLYSFLCPSSLLVIS
jgi:hypothetical protein